MKDFAALKAHVEGRGIVPASLCERAGLNRSMWNYWKRGGGMGKASWDALVSALAKMEAGE